ncbi:RDD family protein [Flammeovirga yaeyamensis]|uniref:RDD family protein n=1 Tax=Flammeovirga yaeyamensis TaxID=367791 RepID=A0AAX1NFI1_9BACT|nr:RDD family protein [Flammeovirga yaeyamensis]MBB3697113.1 putative RDD family membrane protein YckC/DNA-directed RNA polymerase subunit RPC12/RpoP [Flammeovirga yaeyamensis]NMF33776.1 RDD family protein [Flammeovirga yaeyamensis]QWG04958.1 RDD family protein [Flammeovirga yaeyamensis]
MIKLNANNIQTEPHLLKRTIATIIDYGIYFIFFNLYVKTFGELSDDGGYKVNGIASLPIFLIWFIYFPIVEGLFGKTLGHLAVGLKVIDRRGKNITMLQAFKRRFLDPIDLLFHGGIVAFFVVKYANKHQRVGDIVAKTLVVGNEKVFCLDCGEDLFLDPIDQQNGFFECPNCQTKNILWEKKMPN